MKAYRERFTQLQSFLLWALDGGKWATSHPGRFIPRKEPRHPLQRRLHRSQNRSGRSRRGFCL